MPLKKSQIEEFKKRLEDLYYQMTREVRETTANMKSSAEEARGYSQHQADEGTDDFEQTITLELTNKEMGILRQIERALEKIDEGTYGICDVTGDEIAIKRLEAIPYATMTVEAQEKFEKGQLTL